MDQLVIRVEKYFKYSLETMTNEKNLTAIFLMTNKWIWRSRIKSLWVSPREIAWRMFYLFTGERRRPSVQSLQGWDFRSVGGQSERLHGMFLLRQIDTLSAGRAELGPAKVVPASSSSYQRDGQWCHCKSIESIASSEYLTQADRIARVKLC